MTLHFDDPRHEEAFRQAVLRVLRFGARALVVSAVANAAYLHPVDRDEDSRLRS